MCMIQARTSEIWLLPCGLRTVCLLLICYSGADVTFLGSEAKETRSAHIKYVVTCYGAKASRFAFLTYSSMKIGRRSYQSECVTKQYVKAARSY